MASKQDRKDRGKERKGRGDDSGNMIQRLFSSGDELTSQEHLLILASSFLLGMSIQRWIRDRLGDAAMSLRTPPAKAALCVLPRPHAPTLSDERSQTPTRSLARSLARSRPACFRSFARWAAAMRAVESLENDSALVVDDMAERMSGRRAFRRCLSNATPSNSERMYQVSELVLGTWWFDRSLMTLLTSNSLHSARGWLSARLRNSARGLAGPPRQVVVVGSGFDTRPWRMALPPMTKWLEIDVPEVASAKKRRLRAVNAELRMNDFTGMYPLRTIQWDLHAADVTNERLNFGKVLDMYGFDVTAPIVWVVENVLMYLSPEHVNQLLSRMSAVSSAGSIVIANSTVNRNAELVGEGKHGTYPSDVVSHWVSSLPESPADLEVVLSGANWDLMESCTQHEIAEAVCDGRDVASMCAGGVGQPVGPGEHRPTDVYFFARKF